MQSDKPERLSSHQNRGLLADDTSRPRIALLAPKTLVKKVKDALEAHANLDKVKIRPATIEEQKASLQGTALEPRPDVFLVPTKLSVGIEQLDLDTFAVKQDLLHSLGLAAYELDIGIIAIKQAYDTHGFLGSERGCKDGPCSHEASASERSSMNPLARTICHWLDQLPCGESEPPFARDVVLAYSWTYMIYPPLLLLPPLAPSYLSSVFASQGRSLPNGLLVSTCSWLLVDGRSLCKDSGHGESFAELLLQWLASISLAAAWHMRLAEEVQRIRK